MNAIDILAQHVVATLPDSIIERRHLLVALAATMRRNHGAYISVLDQIRAIDAVQKLQDELPLKFKGGAK